MDPTEILEGASPTDGGGDTAGDEAASMVLHNHDLLLDIMLRLDLHASLARSIFVCKRWSFIASDPFLLRMFRRSHPPRLLGFYVATRSTTTHVVLRPRFVPMPPPPPESDQPPPPPDSDQPIPAPESDQQLPPPESDQPSPPLESDQPPPPPLESDQPPPPPESDQPPPPPETDQPPPPPESDQPPPQTESDQPPPPPEAEQPPQQELDAAVRMVQSYRGLDAYDEDFACICDLKNDTMLVSGFYGRGCPALEVHWPLSPHRGVVAVPVVPFNHLDDPACTAGNFLLKVDQGGRDSLVYVWLSMAFLWKVRPEYSVKYKAHVYVLQDDGQWRFRASAAAVLPSPKSDSNPVLIGTKIYLEHCTSIAALDIKTSTFSTIPLPEGMEKYDYQAMMLAPVNDDVGIFLVHLDEDLQLFMWLHIDHIGPGWILIDVVYLPEMFETLGMTGWTDFGEPATLLQTTQTGDFLEFVFLKLGQCAFCFDTRRRVLRKVYEETQVDITLDRIHPIMMTWPPKFPALKSDRPARNVS